MVRHPAPSRGPMFQLSANQGLIVKPGQYLSLGLYFKLFAHSSTEIWTPKVFLGMRPTPGGHWFNFTPPLRFCKAGIGAPIKTLFQAFCSL